MRRLPSRKWLTLFLCCWLSWAGCNVEFTPLNLFLYGSLVSANCNVSDNIFGVGKLLRASQMQNIFFIIINSKYIDLYTPSLICSLQPCIVFDLAKLLRICFGSLGHDLHNKKYFAWWYHLCFQTFQIHIWAFILLMKCHLDIYPETTHIIIDNYIFFIHLSTSSVCRPSRLPNQLQSAARPASCATEERGDPLGLGAGLRSVTSGSCRQFGSRLGSIMRSPYMYALMLVLNLDVLIQI
jgi:hypothetical protein